MADVLRDHMTTDGTLLVVLVYTMYWNGWNNYTHFATRFQDPSLFHAGLLFVYIAGLAGMVVHTQGVFEHHRGFAISACIQSTALL